MGSQGQSALLLAAYGDFIGFSGDPGNPGSELPADAEATFGGAVADPDGYFDDFLASLNRYGECCPEARAIAGSVVLDTMEEFDDDSDMGDDGPDRGAEQDIPCGCHGGGDVLAHPGAGIEFDDVEPEWLDPLYVAGGEDGYMDESSLEVPTFTEILPDDAATDVDDAATDVDDTAADDAAADNAAADNAAADDAAADNAAADDAAADSAAADADNAAADNAATDAGILRFVIDI